MKQSLVVVTWGGNLEVTLDSFLKSLGEYRKYPLTIVINESGLVTQRTLTLLKYYYNIIENKENVWECGAIASIVRKTDIDEFIFLQDTMIIKDSYIFEAMFDINGSVSFGPHWWSYLGKYTRTTLEKIRLPRTITKEHSMYQEVEFTRQYLEAKDVPVPVIFPDWGDDNPKNTVEERFGRKNLVLYNPYITKYKGTVASLDGFRTTSLTWDQLKENWEQTGSYYGPIV
jgi:hypothetical protein